MEVFVKKPKGKVVHKAWRFDNGKLSKETYCSKDIDNMVESPLMPPDTGCKRCFKE